MYVNSFCFLNYFIVVKYTKREFPDRMSYAFRLHVIENMNEMEVCGYGYRLKQS